MNTEPETTSPPPPPPPPAYEPPLITPIANLRDLLAHACTGHGGVDVDVDD